MQGYKLYRLQGQIYCLILSWRYNIARHVGLLVLEWTSNKMLNWVTFNIQECMYFKYLFKIKVKFCIWQFQTFIIIFLKVFEHLILFKKQEMASSEKNIEENTLIESKEECTLSKTQLKKLRKQEKRMAERPQKRFALLDY